ncbi:MAG TPA: hypothetical protein VFR21_09030 [Bradyrhizobium sp.]|nr:hypothetical protein [Bradyrhizobium sp.]
MSLEALDTRPRLRASKFFSGSFALLLSLSLLSWGATYYGMLEYFFENKTELTGAMYVFLAAVVALIQTTILYTLHLLFSRRLNLLLFCFAVLFYILLSFVTVAFGFGFFWKIISASGETLKSAESSIAIVSVALNRSKDRLENLQFTLDGLAAYSKRVSEQETAQGNTCPGASRAGVGPRTRMRNADASRFANAREYVARRVDRLKDDINALGPQFSKIAKNDSSTIDKATGTHVVFMTELNKKLDLTVNNLNDLREDPQLLQYRDEFQKRADQTSFPDDRGGTFLCQDENLRQQINGVVRATNELPLAEHVKIALTEGSYAVAQAITRVKNTAFAVAAECLPTLFRACALPPSAAEIRDTRAGRIEGPAGARTAALTEQQAGIGRDDVLPLVMAIILDLAILFVAINRSREQHVRGDVFAERLREAYRQVFGRSPRDFERTAPIRAIVFQRLGAHYAAVPLDFRDPKTAPRRASPPAWVTGGAQGAQSAAVDGDDEPLREAYYLSHVFADLERERFVKLVGVLGRLFTPEWVARKALARQGSRYARVRAFRIYRFYARAWNDMEAMLAGGSASSHRESSGDARAAPSAPFPVPGDFEPREPAPPDLVADPRPEPVGEPRRPRIPKGYGPRA